jgi:GT2 family glycosyltransferase
MAKPLFSICIPFQSDDSRRQAIYAWLSSFYRYHLPMAEVCTGVDDADSPAVNLSRMRNNAVQHASTNTLICIDADALLAPSTILDIVTCLKSGWSLISLDRLYWLRSLRTQLLLQFPPSSPMPDIMLNRDTEGYPLRDFCGLFFAVTRKTFDIVHGFDDRMYGWGCEDDAFHCAVNGAVGPTYRFGAPIYHIKHPRSSEQTSQNAHYAHSMTILREYKAIQATGDRKAMREYCKTRA